GDAGGRNDAQVYGGGGGGGLYGGGGGGVASGGGGGSSFVQLNAPWNGTNITYQQATSGQCDPNNNGCITITPTP
ncbi:MAG TPA: hypothetical protein VKB39_02135, partial [Candidatus Baltobacteraceae bacterium]|nr:hypothetical protein [Candidatus Baltobacteraceae bacterium]